jgi:hypothetical protein
MRNGLDKNEPYKTDTEGNQKTEPDGIISVEERPLFLDPGVVNEFILQTVISRPTESAESFPVR